MEINMMTVTYCLLAFVTLISTVISIPIDTQEATDMHLEEKRPKYMDTRDLDFFKELVYVSLQKLEKEGKINKYVLEKESIEDETDNEDNTGTVDKRNRHLRLCLRRNGSSYIPYPCWRRG